MKAIPWFVGWLSFLDVKISRPGLGRMYPFRSLLKPGKQDDNFAVFSRFQRRTPGLLHGYFLFLGLGLQSFPQREPSLFSGMAFWGLGGEGAKLTSSTRSAWPDLWPDSCESPWDSQACRLDFFGLSGAYSLPDSATNIAGRPSSLTNKKRSCPQTWA